MFGDVMVALMVVIAVVALVAGLWMEHGPQNKDSKENQNMKEQER